MRRAVTGWRYRWDGRRWVLRARMFQLFGLDEDARPPWYLR